MRVDANVNCVMKLNKSTIDEFKKIYLEEFRKELSDKEAESKAIKTLSLFRGLKRRIVDLSQSC